MLKIEVWSDFVCPFCYIGKRRVEQAIAQAGVPVEIIYRAFQLSPEAPWQSEDNLNVLLQKRYGMSKEQAEDTNRRVGDMARGLGLDLNFAAARWANTFDAHRLAKLAASHGRENEVVELIFAAFFTNGLRIGDPETLRLIGRKAGLPVEDLDRLLASDWLADRIDEDRLDGNRHGVRSVPHYLIDGRVIDAGRLDPDMLRRMSERVHGGLTGHASNDR